MSVRRPAWWFYPERCEHGHEWGPGRVIVSFERCDCPSVPCPGRTPGRPVPGPASHGRDRHPHPNRTTS